jgi:chitodextrinase
MVKDVTGTGKTGALDTDFLVRPSRLSFGEVTTCDDNIFREKILTIDNLGVTGATFTVTITKDPIGGSDAITLSKVVGGEDSGLTPVTVTLTTPAGTFLNYPDGSNGYMGEIIIEKNGSTQQPIRVPWFLAVRNELIRPSGQCRSAHPIQFITDPKGVITDSQLPADIGTCKEEEAIWRVSACGFSADTKVCFGSFAGGVCTGDDVSAIPGSFCPTGGNTGATIDVAVPTTPVGTTVDVVMHDQCTSLILGTHTYVGVDEVPVASFMHDAPKCIEEEVQFTDTSTNLPRTWAWDFGDDLPRSSEWNPKHVYSAPGTYTVTLTVTNPCGAVPDLPFSADVTILGPSFTHDAPACVGEEVQFTDTSPGSPTSWSWDFGDGDTSTLQNPTHTYTSDGTHTVTLTTDICGPAFPFTKSVLISCCALYLDNAFSFPGVPFAESSTLGGARVTVEGTGMFPGLNPEVIVSQSGKTVDLVTPSSVSPDGTSLDFISVAHAPVSFDIQVETTCCGDPYVSNVLQDELSYYNWALVAQPGEDKIEFLDVDTNTSVGPIRPTEPLDVAITQAPLTAEQIAAGEAHQIFSLEKDEVTGNPVLARRPLSNSADTPVTFDFNAVDEIPNEVAADPVDPGLVYVTSITKLSAVEPAGVRVLDVSAPAAITSPALIELHNCLDADDDGYCDLSPVTPASKTFATDVEVIAVNPTVYGVPFQVDDPVTVAADPAGGCGGPFSKDDLTQRYGYATSSDALRDSAPDGQPHLSILDFNPCAIDDIVTGNITLVSNPLHRTEVEVFGKPGTILDYPGPKKEMGLTLAKNVEGAFIYALARRKTSPSSKASFMFKIDAVSRDFAYGKLDFTSPPGAGTVPNAQDVAVVERDLDGEATLIAAVDGANESLRVFDAGGTEIAQSPVSLGATSAPDDIAVNGDFTLIYVSLSGTGVIQEIALPNFTPTRQLEPPGGGSFAGTLKGLALDSADKLYVCEDFAGAGDRVAKFTIPSSGTQLIWEEETTDVIDPVDIAVDELSAPAVVAVLDLGGGEPTAPGQLKLFDLALSTAQGTLNTLKDPRDVVTEDEGVYVVAELGAGSQTGDVRLFKQTIQGTSKKVIRGQFGASGIDILGDSPSKSPFTPQGVRYVASDVELGRVLELAQTLIFGIGNFPNDAATVGEGAQQQVWVSSGEPGDTTSDGSTNIIQVFRTVDDSEVLDATPPDEVPINCTLPFPDGEDSFAPTSMAVADFPIQEIRKVFVTMFDSGVVLVYDAIGPNQFRLNPTNGGKITVGAGPRRIAIQPEIIEEEVP